MNIFSVNKESGVYPNRECMCEICNNTYDKRDIDKLNKERKKYHHHFYGEFGVSHAFICDKCVSHAAGCEYMANNNPCSDCERCSENWVEEIRKELLTSKWKGYKL